jgi:LysM repeat protein
MLSALALASVLYSVKPGDTLSGIAQQYNTTWEAIYADNHAAITNPNMVFAGQQLRIPEGGTTANLVPAQAPAATATQQAPSVSAAQSAPVKTYKVASAPAAATVHSTQASSAQASTAATSGSTGSSASTASAGSSSGGLSDIPGVPSSFAACVAYRESTNDTNPAANGDAYGIIPASGYNVEGTSLANQKQVFKEIYDTTGPSAWAADGCNK